MLNQKEMFDAIAHSKVVTNEMVEILRELDVTESRVTQASLNSMLLDLRNRVIKGEKLVLESDNTIFKNKHIFDAWVQDTFDEYSVELYMSSI